MGIIQFYVRVGRSLISTLHPQKPIALNTKVGSISCYFEYYPRGYTLYTRPIFERSTFQIYFMSLFNRRHVSFSLSLSLPLSHTHTIAHTTKLPKIHENTHFLEKIQSKAS